MWWKVDFTQQPAIPAQWLDQEEAPKHFSKPNLHQKKITVTIWWSATRLTHYSFLNPSKTISSEKYAQQINEMHWKLQHLQLALVIRKDSILLTPCTTKASKVERNGLWCFVSSAIFTWTHTNQLPLFKQINNFFQGKCFHNQQEVENTFQAFIESQSMGFYTTGINKHVSLAKMCWL